MSVSPFRRDGSPFWYIRREIAGVGRVTLSTRTTSAALARKYDQLLLDLRDLGQLDAIQALKNGSVSFRELLAANASPARTTALLTRASSPLLKPLVQEWVEEGAKDRGIRERSMRRYVTSWSHCWEILSPTATLNDINAEFVAAFKRFRVSRAKSLGTPLSAATLNRDLAAIGAFLTWCAESKNLKIERPVLRYQRESRGRLRWLSTEELRAFREHCPPEWEALFQLLFGTGMTISEALGLRSADIDVLGRRVSIHEEFGRTLKRESRARELSIPQPVIELLAQRLRAVENRPDALLFEFTYWTARKAWNRVCKAASIYGATIHDARHTFAVHAVQDGIPEARLQKLLGHAHPGTTRRYAMHAPEAFLEDDGDRIARRMGLSPTPTLRLVRGA